MFRLKRDGIEHRKVLAFLFSLFFLFFSIFILLKEAGNWKRFIVLSFNGPFGVLWNRRSSNSFLNEIK